MSDTNQRVVANKRILMRIVIQLIENCLKQQVPTVLISTDSNKYLFNVPSSYQRFTKEHKVQFPSGARFFFTKTATTTVTGLIGLLLTLYQTGCSGVKLYTDEKMFRWMEELRYKMGFKAAPISYVSWGGQYRKGMLHNEQLEEMLQRPDYEHAFEHLHQYIEEHLPKAEQNDATEFYDHQRGSFRDKDLEIVPFFVEEQGELITNYVIVPGALPGAILPQKLKELGVKGKNIGVLTANGKVVIDGRTILEEEAREPSTPSPNVVLLHYRHRQTIPIIMQSARLRPYLEDKETPVYAVVHLVEDATTVQSEQFRELVSAFPPTTHHLVYNPHLRNSQDTLQDRVQLSAQVQLVSSLSRYFPSCLPDLESLGQQDVQKFIGASEAVDLLFPGNRVTAARRCHELVLAPRKSWGYRAVGTADKGRKGIGMDLQVPAFAGQLQERYALLFKECNPKAVFLGTGSMKPSKYRNVSAILVQWSPNCNILLDCGEGSHIQLQDHYGWQRYEQVLLDLRILFITHIHSDHNLGLLDVISQRNKLLRARGLDPDLHRLFLVLPANVVPWYHSFCNNVEDLNWGAEVIFTQALRQEDYSFQGTMSKEPPQKCPTKPSRDKDEQDEQDEPTIFRPEWQTVITLYGERQPASLVRFHQYLQAVGIAEFNPCPVIHCPQSYGICILHPSGVKVSYSGDTRPCPEFAQAAKDSTLLIHEATFGDDLERNARSHYHSTVGEAMDIAMRAKSWKLALTHFSQRYNSTRDIVDPSNYSQNKVKREFAQKHTIVCFDHLEIAMDNAHLMPYISRAIAGVVPSEHKE